LQTGQAYSTIAPMADTWTVQDAKAQLSELLRRARAGEPQRIGVTDACVVVSEKDWAALHPESPASSGKWRKIQRF